MAGHHVQVGSAFELVGHQGALVRSSDFRGRFLLIFFGFTRCRVVCPEVLSKLSRVLNRLGPLIKEIQPLYISVDPDRDTPEVMDRFLGERYPLFVGLTGSRDDIDHVRANYKVFVRRTIDEDDPAGYALSHSALVFFMDRAGEYCAHFADGTPDEEIEQRIRVILSESQHGARR